MYASTTYSSYEGCYSFYFSGSYFTSKTDYIADYWGTNNGYDIAYENGNIWMAVDNATSPIRCYEATSGGVLQMVPASIGIGSTIRGMAYETGTDSPYIWASNTTTDELYRIEIDPPTALERATWGEIKAQF
jgi:hypothetical protein